MIIFAVPQFSTDNKGMERFKNNKNIRVAIISMRQTQYDLTQVINFQYIEMFFNNSDKSWLVGVPSCLRFNLLVKAQYLIKVLIQYFISSKVLYFTSSLSALVPFCKVYEFYVYLLNL